MLRIFKVNVTILRTTVRWQIICIFSFKLVPLPLFAFIVLTACS